MILRNVLSQFFIVKCFSKSLLVRILTLHEIKVLKIDATEIYANLVENLNDFQIKEINAK